MFTKTDVFNLFTNNSDVIIDEKRQLEIKVKFSKLSRSNFKNFTGKR